MIQVRQNLNPVGNACTLINGIPYVVCRRCGVQVKLFDAVSQKIVIGKWADEEEYITNVHGHIEAVEIKRVLKTWTGHGCFDCHFQFQKLEATLKSTGKRAFFPSSECGR